MLDNKENQDTQLIGILEVDNKENEKEENYQINDRRKFPTAEGHTFQD